MKTPKFEYIPVDGLETDAISIREGKYDGVDFVFGMVRFNELEDEQMQMQFNYDILKKPDGFIDDENFHKFAGDLLVEILEKEMPSLTQETTFENIDSPPSLLEENIKDLKTRQAKEREVHANSGTDDSTTSDSH